MQVWPEGWHEVQVLSYLLAGTSHVSWPLHRGLFAMQKVYNLLGVLGFVMSGTMAVMGVMAYTRVPSMVKKHISDIKLELTETLTQMVPTQIEGALPEFPKATGPAVPFQN